MMRDLERTVDWLRPLVETKAWDYCIVWKFGDDPSRFFEWIGCCCGGSHGDCKNVKEEISGEKQHLLTLCKDTFVEHSVRARACERLVKFPSSLPLYSGIHGEVAMTNQPRWLTHESSGTQVLIPVDSSMIELFSGELVPQDQQLIDFMMAQFNVFVEHEKPSNPFLGQNMKLRPDSLPYLSFIPKLQFLSTVSKSSSYPSLEGSSTGSTPSSSVHVSPNHLIGKSMDSLGCENSAVGKEKLKGRQKTGPEKYQSKNLVTERNRRNRIKAGHFALRALVPNISKMDRAAILGDAVDYIHELEKNIKELRDELQEEKWNNSTVELEVPQRKIVHESMEHSYALQSVAATAQSGGSTKAVKPIEVQVEVNQIGSRDFLLRLVCSQKRGGFLRMMEIINSLGLQVVDANVTTCNGRVLNTLKVEAERKDLEPKKLKDSLLTTWSSQTADINAVSRRI